MRLRDKSIYHKELADVYESYEPPSLSEQAYSLIRIASFERVGWDKTHTVDETMQAEFEAAASRVAKQNYPLHKGSFKPNAMLTVNVGQIARRHSELPEQTRRRIIKNLQNLYRYERHRFAGFWRFEIFGGSSDGEHLHIVFHAPRGMRDKLLNALPEWTNDGLGTLRTSRHFRSPNWRVCSLVGTWHLRRVYRIEGIIEYLAKLPIGSDNKPLSREKRLGFPNRRVREFGTFGLLQREP